MEASARKVALLIRATLKTFSPLFLSQLEFVNSVWSGEKESGISVRKCLRRAEHRRPMSVSFSIFDPLALNILKFEDAGLLSCQKCRQAPLISRLTRVVTETHYFSAPLYTDI